MNSTSSRRSLAIPPVMEVSSETTVADFLSALLERVEAADLAHVGPAHQHWLSSGLRDLLTCVLGSDHIARAGHREIGRAVQFWVCRHLAPDRAYRVLPYFALACGRFVADHYRGGSVGLESDADVVIQGSVPDEALGPFEFLYNSEFKTRFTRASGGVPVLIRVPPFGQISDLDSRVLLQPGTELGVLLRKCPTSHGWHDFVSFQARGQATSFDYFAASWVYASHLEDDSIRGRVPLTWVVAEGETSFPAGSPGIVACQWTVLPKSLRPDWMTMP